MSGGDVDSHSIGSLIGAGYAWWSLLVLMGTLGPHYVLALLYGVLWSRNASSRAMVVLEVLYGGLNPVAYLLVLQPALFRPWTPSWLPLVCWVTWGAFWGARLFGANQPLAGSAPRLWVRRLLQGTIAVVCALAARDAIAAVTGVLPSPEKTLETAGIINVLLCAPLYALPLLAAFRHLAETRSDELWATSPFFFAASPARLKVLGVAALGLSIAMSVPSLSEAAVHALLLEHKQAIVRVSRERQLDPRLLAAIIAVTQRETTSPFRTRLESWSADAWLLDSKSGLLLAEAIDPSLGISQVKANTVLTAFLIVEASRSGKPAWVGKDYRSARFRSREALKRIPSPALAQVALPPGDAFPYKAEVVRALQTARGNVELAAFLLDLVATQWETANPDWSIRKRPDILATLFQIGFDRSVPKATPRANDFGQHVQRAYDSPWMTLHFGPGALAP